MDLAKLEDRLTLDWCGGRDTHSDYWGEEYYLSDSWTFKGTVRESVPRGEPIYIELKISGRREGKKRRRLRPHRWGATMRMGSLRVDFPPLPRGAGSVIQVMEMVEKEFRGHLIKEVLSRAYDRESTQCIWRQQKDGSWEPYLTTFRFRYFDAMQLPEGKYLIVSARYLSYRWRETFSCGPRCDLEGFFVDRGWLGYGGTCGSSQSPLARSLGHWGVEANPEPPAG